MKKLFSKRITAIFPDFPPVEWGTPLTPYKKPYYLLINDGCVWLSEEDSNPHCILPTIIRKIGLMWHYRYTIRYCGEQADSPILN